MKKRIIAFILMLMCLSTLMFQKVNIAQVDAANNSYYNQLIGRGRCNWGRVDQGGNNLHVASVPRIPSDKAQTKSDEYKDYFNIYCYYTDLNEKHWAYRYICLAKYFGIMSGVGNNQFGGEDVYIQACYYLRALCKVNNASCTRNHYYYNSTGYISRFDAIYAIWNNANRPHDDEEVSSIYNSWLYNYIYRFPELNNSKYYTWRNGRKCLNSYGKAITWSLYTGILSGSDGELLLDDYLTRAQTAKILVDYYLNQNEEKYAKTETYDWYYYINIDANDGIINTDHIDEISTGIKFNNDIELKKSFVSRSGYTLKGWNLYRPLDETWYVDGKGWFSEDTISAKNYTKKTFSPTTSIKFDPTIFLDNVGNITTVTSFTFYAVWEKTTYNTTYNIKIKNNGCYGYRSTMNVTFGDYIYLYKSLVSRSGYTLKGWNLYRPTDKTWYVNGNWYSTATILARNYSKTTYSPTTSIKLDERFFKGVSDSTTVTSFVVYPVWEKNTLFADVPTYHWAYNYIYKADALGIMVGVGSNKFEPDSYIQKNDFYAVLNRVSSWKYYSNSDTCNISRNDAVYLFWENACGEPSIKDSVNSFSSSRVWYYINNSSDIYGIYKNYGYNYAKAWAWCIDNKIISGTSNGNYEPYRSITRAETARIFVDYYNILY